MVRPLKNINHILERTLFEFDLNYISDIIFGASMSVDKKFEIIGKCENRGINFYQSMIFKDDKDYEAVRGQLKQKSLWRLGS